MEERRELGRKRLRPLHGIVAILAVLAILLTEEACISDGDLVAPDAPVDLSSATETSGPLTVHLAGIGPLIGPDKRFNEIANSIPEFAGYWMDDAGNMVVGLTDLSKRPAVASRTRNELAAKVTGTGGSIRYEQVTYGFNRLAGWKEDIASRISGTVTLLDIDQTTNTLSIGVENQTEINGVLSLAATLSIPLDAISVVIASRPQPDIGDRSSPQHQHMLGSWFPQTLGGIRVRFPDAAGGCSLGLGVGIGSSNRYITTAHCSDIGTLETSLAMHQPSTNASDRIGYEVEDPRSTCLWESPWNDDNTLCRWADVAVFSDDPQGSSRFKQGWIATTESNTGSASRRHNHTDGDSVYTIDGEGGEVVGERVIKVGASVGRRHGRVRRDCVDILGWVENYTIRCQNLADYEASGGDSGAPVFYSDGQFYGIHIGRHQIDGEELAVYSPIANIEEEVGAVDTQGDQHLAFRINRGRVRRMAEVEEEQWR